jgi:hypothetical protein
MRDELRSPRRTSCLTVESRRHAAACLVTFAIILTTAACGGGDDSGGDEPAAPPSQSTPGTGVTVRGAERIAWDQIAPSSQQLAGYAFTAYVDGTAGRMTGVECGETVTASGYRCSAPLPPMTNGTHVLQISAIVAGAESQRSQPLTVTMSQGRMVSAVASGEATGRAASESHCLEASDLCLARRHEVTRPLPVSSPVAMPDGRLLFVEDGRTVRVLANGVVGDEPALAMTGARARIVALLIDPEFERTRFVRVAWTEEQPARGRVLTLGRLREVNGRLGEMAVIVPEIPVSGEADPHVAHDSEGRIYITMPAADGTGRASDPYAGQILTVDADGRSATGGPTPIVARGYDRPGALTVDARTRRLWLSGSARDLGQRVMSIALDDRRAQPPSGAATSAGRSWPAAAILGFAPFGPARVGEAPAFLALDADGTLMVVRADAQVFVQQGAVALDAGKLLSLEAGPGGPVFVTAVSAGDTGPAFSIYRLEPER